MCGELKKKGTTGSQGRGNEDSNITLLACKFIPLFIKHMYTCISICIRFSFYTSTDIRIHSKKIVHFYETFVCKKILYKNINKFFTLQYF